MSETPNNFRALPEFCEVSSDEEIIPLSQVTEHDGLRSLNRFWRERRRERAEREPSPPEDDYEPVNHWLRDQNDDRPDVDPDLSDDGESNRDGGGESSSTSRTVMLVDSLNDFSDLELPMLPLSQLTEEQRKPPENPWLFRHVPVPVIDHVSDTDSSDEAGYECAQQQVRKEIDWGSDDVEELVQASQQVEEDAERAVGRSGIRTVMGDGAGRNEVEGGGKRGDDGGEVIGGPSVKKKRKLDENVDDNFLDLR
jgi:hypothetical protein